MCSWGASYDSACAKVLPVIMSIMVDSKALAVYHPSSVCGRAKTLSRTKNQVQ